MQISNEDARLDSFSKIVETIGLAVYHDKRGKSWRLHSMSIDGNEISQNMRFCMVQLFIVDDAQSTMSNVPCCWRMNFCTLDELVDAFMHTTTIFIDKRVKCSYVDNPFYKMSIEEAMIKLDLEKGKKYV